MGAVRAVDGDGGVVGYRTNLASELLLSNSNLKNKCSGYRSKIISSALYIFK